MRVPSSQNHFAWKGHLPFQSLYTVGLAGQKFLEALKSDGKILGASCSKCKQVYVPASLFCERCFAELTDHVPVGPEGEVVTFSVCHEDVDGNHLDTPQIAAAVMLKGATTVLVHKGLGKPEDWKIGKQAKVKLAANRTGSILDIEGFELL